MKYSIYIRKSPESKERRVMSLESRFSELKEFAAKEKLRKEIGTCLSQSQPAKLPRMKQQLGVVAIYHYSRPDKGDESTVVVWENPEAVKSYRESDLIKEAIAYEQKLGLHETTTREGYPLIFSANQKD